MTDQDRRVRDGPYPRRVRTAAAAGPGLGGRDGGLLDRCVAGAGSRCLDVGCGPGETMRLMAERVGPTGRVVGLDTDEDLGRTRSMLCLRASGLEQCAFVPADVEGPDPFPAFPDGSTWSSGG